MMLGRPQLAMTSAYRYPQSFQPQLQQRPIYSLPQQPIPALLTPQQQQPIPALLTSQQQQPTTNVSPSPPQPPQQTSQTQQQQPPQPPQTSQTPQQQPPLRTPTPDGIQDVLKYILKL